MFDVEQYTCRVITTNGIAISIAKSYIIYSLYPSQRNDENDDEEVDVVTLMKQSLPGYVVNCMLAAGYDDVNIIGAMNVSDDQGNSISIIWSVVDTISSPDFLSSLQSFTSFTSTYSLALSSLCFVSDLGMAFDWYAVLLLNELVISESKQE